MLSAESVNDVRAPLSEPTAASTSTRPAETKSPTLRAFAASACPTASVVEAGANVLVAGNAVFGQKDRRAAMAAIRAAASGGAS